MKQAMWFNNEIRHYVEILDSTDIGSLESIMGNASMGYGEQKEQRLDIWLEENLNAPLLACDFYINSRLRYKMVKSEELMPKPDEIYSIIKFSQF